MKNLVKPADCDDVVLLGVVDDSVVDLLNLSIVVVDGDVYEVSQVVEHSRLSRS